MINSFKKHVLELWPDVSKRKALLAISGGLDSVVLAHLWHATGWPFELAHCNFSLRGDESDGDENFVRSLASNLGAICHFAVFDTKTHALIHKLSVQEAARQLRYDHFKKLSTQMQCDYILTAHHANDQLETYLINTLRGTGLKGLTGIPAQNNDIIRPLLPFSRECYLSLCAIPSIVLARRFKQPIIRLFKKCNSSKGSARTGQLASQFDFRISTNP